jgi:hypothetical protein
MDVEKFGGFTPPVSNYFRMPNQWINICSEIKSLAELKVVQYVLRHTWGFQEYDGKPKPITTDEFMHGRKKGDGKERIDNGTGLSNRSVIDGLRDAIEHGFLVCVTDDKDKARITKSYALNMASLDSDVKNLHSGIRCEESSQPAMKKVHTDVKNLHSDCERSSQRSEKDTKEKHLKKNTKERKNGNAPAKRKSSHSSTHSSLSLSQFSSSQETKPEEVILSEEEQVIYEYACQTIFKAKPPLRTAKLQGECAEIAKHVKTAGQFESLVQFVRALPYIQGQVHLKNLVNGLNGWLDSLEAHPTTSHTKPRGSFTMQEVTAEDIERAKKNNAEARAKMQARKQAQQEGARA